MSRSTVPDAAACSLVAAASIPQLARARAESGPGQNSEATIRKEYAAWDL
jgi:hypothetical protein